MDATEQQQIAEEEVKVEAEKEKADSLQIKSVLKEKEATTLSDKLSKVDNTEKKAA